MQPVVNEIFEISRFTLVFRLFRNGARCAGEGFPVALKAFDAA